MNSPQFANADREFRYRAEQERDEARAWAAAWKRAAKNYKRAYKQHKAIAQNLNQGTRRLHRELAEARAVNGWTYAEQLQRELCAAEERADRWRTVALVAVAVAISAVAAAIVTLVVTSTSLGPLLLIVIGLLVIIAVTSR